MGTICNLQYQGWTTDRSQWTRPLSRLLVLLTTLLLLAMPVTEHLCNWDKFLRGGPDVEFNLLAWLLFAAMVVLSMHGSMLRPRMMQPGMFEPLSTAMSAPADRAAASELLEGNGISASAKTRSRSRRLDEPMPAPLIQAAVLLRI